MNIQKSLRALLAINLDENLINEKCVAISLVSFSQAGSIL
jgi:hypothetical protein